MLEVKDDVIVHPFADCSGVAFFNKSNQQAVTINCTYDEFLQIMRRANSNYSSLSEEEKVFVYRLKESLIL